MHLIGNLRCRLVRVAQFYFDACDEGTVYPVFGCGAAGLSDDGAQVSLSEAHAVGIVDYLVMLIVISNLFYSNALDDKISLPEDKGFSLGYGYLIWV